MNSKEFLYFRKKLNKTQSEMAQLLITSIKAVRSYEQGWRSVPAQVERQIFFLVSRKQDPSKRQKPCWITKKISPEHRKKCPAWEFQAGHLCWFVCGTIRQGTIQRGWNKKMTMCRDCKVLQPLLLPKGALTLKSWRHIEL